MRSFFWWKINIQLSRFGQEKVLPSTKLWRSFQLNLIGSFVKMSQLQQGSTNATLHTTDYAEDNHYQRGFSYTALFSKAWSIPLFNKAFVFCCWPQNQVFLLKQFQTFEFHCTYDGLLHNFALIPSRRNRRNGALGPKLPELRQGIHSGPKHLSHALSLIEPRKSQTHPQLVDTNWMATLQIENEGAEQATSRPSAINWGYYIIINLHTM